MKGWYAIYECSGNKWLTEGINWLNDRDYHNVAVGTKHAIRTQQSYNSSNGYEIDVIDTQTEWLLRDSGAKVNPNTIMRFETMGEAEEYLLGILPSTSDSFYSIRKIYF